MNLTATARNFRPALATKTMLALAFALALTMASQSAFAQTYSVLYNFTGQKDGAYPEAGVTLDRAGNLYGTTYSGGSLANCISHGFDGCGTVYKLSHKGSGWTFAALYAFVGQDGANPQARVVFGPNGALYGTTGAGGDQQNGTVFELQPPANVCPTVSCPWSETVLYAFQGQYNESNPGGGDLIFDPQGNIWGTAGGGNGYLCDDGPCGGVFELTPNGSGWNGNELNPFSGLSRNPFAGLVRDNEGNFYGVTPAEPGGLYSLHAEFYYFSEQSDALGGLILVGSNLIGTTSQGGTGGGGTVFEYSLSGASFTTLYNFAGPNQPEAGPTATLLMDAAGNLYGTTNLEGANKQGSVFKLSQSNGVWSLTTLHDFTGGADGGQPFGQLTMDASGNIYGTTTVGGNTVGSCYQNLGCGVVFEITP